MTVKMGGISVNSTHIKLVITIYSKALRL